MKDSGIDWLKKIPADWNLRRLKLTSKVNPAKSKIKDIKDGIKVSFLPMEYVGENGELNLSLIKQICEVYQGYTYCQDGDVIVAKITPCFENGKGALCSGFSNGLGFASTEFHVIRADDYILPEYIFYVTKSHQFRCFGESSMTGAAGQKRVPDDYIKNYQIVYPNIDEQKIIVTYLDQQTSHIDKLIEKKEKLIILLKEKRQALITEAVRKGLNPDVKMKDSGVEWIGEIPEHWELTQIKRIKSKVKDSLVDGPFGSSVNVATDYVDKEEGVPVVKTVNITDNGFNVNDLKYMRKAKYEEIVRHSIKPNDILFSKVGTIGNACLFPDRFPEGILSTTGSCKITVDLQKVIPRYMVYVLHIMKDHFNLLASSNVQPFLNMTTIGNTKTVLPPVDEQYAILDYLYKKLSVIDKIVNTIETQITKLQEFRQTLISNAVTGKIDVRGEV